MSRTSHIWLFDVDGTLTPAGGQISPEFESSFYSFCLNNDVRIVSGGSIDRIRNQLGSKILNALKASYCCLGNSWWVGGREVFAGTYIPSDELVSALQALANASSYPRTPQGPQWLLKPGMLSFSVPGVDSANAQLQEYAAWDAVNSERTKIAAHLERLFPDLSVLVSGRASIDIGPKTNTKVQVIRDLDRPTIFFADAMHPGGVDAELAWLLRARTDGSQAIGVKDWRETQLILAGMSQRNQPVSSAPRTKMRLLRANNEGFRVSSHRPRSVPAVP